LIENHHHDIIKHVINCTLPTIFMEFVELLVAGRHCEPVAGGISTIVGYFQAEHSQRKRL
jgi:hypothetical protein